MAEVSIAIEEFPGSVFLSSLFLFVFPLRESRALAFRTHAGEPKDAAFALLAPASRSTRRPRKQTLRRATARPNRTQHAPTPRSISRPALIPVLAPLLHGLGAYSPRHYSYAAAPLLAILAPLLPVLGASTSTTTATIVYPYKHRYCSPNSRRYPVITTISTTRTSTAASPVLAVLALPLPVLAPLLPYTSTATTRRSRAAAKTHPALRARTRIGHPPRARTRIDDPLARPHQEQPETARNGTKRPETLSPTQPADDRSAAAKNDYGLHPRSAPLPTQLGSLLPAPTLPVRPSLHLHLSISYVTYPLHTHPQFTLRALFRNPEVRTETSLEYIFQLFALAP